MDPEKAAEEMRCVALALVHPNAETWQHESVKLGWPFGDFRFFGLFAPN